MLFESVVIPKLLESQTLSIINYIWHMSSEVFESGLTTEKLYYILRTFSVDLKSVDFQTKGSQV